MRIIIVLLLFTYSGSFAQVYINIDQNDGTTLSFNIEDVRKITFDGIVNVEDFKMAGNAIKTFTLIQNYPNPFNPSTTIAYQIPKPGNINITIYNLLGKRIKVLKKAYQNAGDYKLMWNGDNDLGGKVSSGIYLLNVKYNDNILSKKLMLIK